MRTDFVGAWKLQSFEIKKPSGETKSWGEDLRGLLIYTDSGAMSVSINRRVTGDPSEPKNVLDSLLFYAGSFNVKKENEIHHDVTIASNPDRVGKQMIRFFERNNNQLILTTPEESYGKATLIWERSE